MKHLIISFSLLGISINTFAQQKPNLYETVKITLDTLPKKPTLVYTYTTWCGGAKESLPKLLPIIKQYREKINLIVIADTTRNIYLNNFEGVKPDAYILLNSFYPKRFLPRKESRDAGTAFSNLYGVKQKLMGNGRYMLDCNQKLMKLIEADNSEDRLQKTLDALEGSCE
ncbi:MAG: thioredoxin family protein [Taibaiella sp.]|jgi:thiol-disulfide isomerase/thioredoxin